MIHGQSLLNCTFWNYALHHAINVRNAYQNTKTGGRSPLSLVSNGKVDLHRSFVFPFGQPVAAKVHEKDWKFDVKRDIGIYLGNSPGTVNGSLVHFPSSGRILPTHDPIPLNISQEKFQRLIYVREDIKRPPSTKLNELSIDIPGTKEDKSSTIMDDDQTVKTSNVFNKEPEQIP